MKSGRRTEPRSPSGIRQWSGADPRGRRAVQPRLRPVAEARAAAGAPFPRLSPTTAGGADRAATRPRISQRVKWRTSPRSSRQRAGRRLCSGCRRADSWRSKPRPAVSPSPGSSPTTAVRGRQRPTRRRRVRGSAHASRRGRQPRRRGEILHEGHGRRAGAHRRDDAPDAVEFAQARSGRPYPPLRRRRDDGVQGSARALRVDRVPALVMNRGKTDPRLKEAAQAIAKAVPAARHRELTGTDAQREARCPDAGSRGVPHGAGGHGVRPDLTRMRCIDSFTRPTRTGSRARSPARS